MDFKSKRLPVNDVRMAMRGKDCLAFKIKKRKIPPPGTKSPA
jgi:hypothetical protein